ncbi:MAG: hypothetical protein GX133_04850 [Syntrophomonadaceae bacterium]|nr:hypothetical protein [Syntrophomonadaceae bacterium]
MVFAIVAPTLVSKIERIIDLDLEVLKLLAELAEDIDDPVLRNLIANMVGEENGNVRFFTLLLLLANGNNNLTGNRRL